MKKRKYNKRGLMIRISKRISTKKRKRLPNLESLLLFVLANYNNENLTETKLHKILYYCDFDSYETNNQPITEATYKNNLYGPTVNELGVVLNKLERGGKIKKVTEENYYGSTQTRYIVTAEKLKFNFEEEPLDIIKDVNERFKSLKPTELSAIAHLDSPSLITEIGKNINYKSVLFRDDDYHISDKERESWKDFLTIKEKSKLLEFT